MTTIGIRQSGDNQLYWVADNVIATDFPPVESALRDPDGLLAIGGDLSPERLLHAYPLGIFPWYSQGQPILWWSPNPRCVLEPGGLKVSRSLRKTLRRDEFKVTFNRDFRSVIRACAEPRHATGETWITEDMAQAFISLHRMGHGVSVEVWRGDVLAGGLYGIAIGKVFFGESMFCRETDASKVALVHLDAALQRQSFRLLDCQVHSRHLQRLGAYPMPRDLFANILTQYCRQHMEYRWPSISMLP